MAAGSRVTQKNRNLVLLNRLQIVGQLSNFGCDLFRIQFVPCGKIDALNRHLGRPMRRHRDATAQNVAYISFGKFAAVALR